MASAFVSQVQVLFRHCDPAGIVFYPRYFEMVNDLVEEWFDRDGRFEGPDGQRRLSARMTIVTMDLRSMKATPLPSDLRERLQAYLVPQDGFTDSTRTG